VCPVGAVSCDEFPLASFKVVGAAKPASEAGARNLLMQRRSIREFKDKAVPRELLERLVETAFHAPTAHNGQPVQLVVVTDKKIINKIDMRVTAMFRKGLTLVDNPVGSSLISAIGGAKTADMLLGHKGDLERFEKAGYPRNLHVFRDAPALVLAHTEHGTITGRDDCNIALSHLTFHASAAGLGVCWIGYIVAAARMDPTLKKQLGIPIKNSLQCACILGWPKYKYKRMIPRKQGAVKWVESD